MHIYKLWKWTIHKVTSSNLVIFRQPFTFVRFQTTEWRHKKKRCTLLLWPPVSFLERMYFMDVPKRDKLSIFLYSMGHNLQLFDLQGCLLLQVWHFSELLYVTVYIHLFKRNNLRKWLNLFFSLHGSNAKSGKKIWYEKIFDRQILLLKSNFHVTCVTD